VISICVPPIYFFRWYAYYKPTLYTSQIYRHFAALFQCRSCPGVSAAFQEIVAATASVRLFYGNIYYLFSVGRACNYVEELRHLDTVAVVDLKTLTGKKNFTLFDKI